MSNINIINIYGSVTMNINIKGSSSVGEAMSRVSEASNDAMKELADYKLKRQIKEDKEYDKQRKLEERALRNFYRANSV